MQIVLNKLTKRYNKQTIFTDLDYVFEPNETYALVGYNGSGKSTLIQILYNYNTISNGEICYYLNNQLIDENAQKFMAFAAPYVDLPEELTLQEIINFHFSIKQKRSDIDIDLLLKQASLIDHTTKMIKYFSSGMKQRVKLILAFATLADLLLLDEPCSNFDQAGIEWYKKCIELVKGKCTIIVASNQTYEYDFCQNTLDIIKYK
jgi:ABC-type multidrug transport system ATPase subunit